MKQNIVDKWRKDEFGMLVVRTWHEVQAVPGGTNRMVAEFFIADHYVHTQQPYYSVTMPFDIDASALENHRTVFERFCRAVGITGKFVAAASALGGLANDPFVHWVRADNYSVEIS